jgi:hypothetical protein
VSEANGDLGAERRAVMYAALGDALDVCARPEFGEPKPIRLVYDNGHISEMGLMKPRDLLSHIRETGAKEPVRIEKWWRTVSRWEPCWTVERGWQ